MMIDQNSSLGAEPQGSSGHNFLDDLDNFDLEERRKPIVVKKTERLRAKVMDTQNRIEKIAEVNRFPVKIIEHAK
jgi:hypothetical protein